MVYNLLLAVVVDGESLRNKRHRSNVGDPKVLRTSRRPASKKLSNVGVGLDTVDYGYAFTILSIK